MAGRRELRKCLPTANFRNFLSHWPSGATSMRYITVAILPWSFVEIIAITLFMLHCNSVRYKGIKEIAEM